MAIADRATASAEVTGTSLTYAHSVGGSADLAIWAGVTSWQSSGAADPTGVTYAGAALTELADFLGGGGNDNACSLWRRVAPATGSNNVVVTHSASHDITALSISYSGVDQTTPNDAVQELDSTDPDPTHSVTSETGDQVVSFIMGWSWTTLGEDGDLTIRLENNNSSGLNSIAVGDAPGAASVNASWTTVAYSDPHGLFSFNVNQATGAGPQTVTLNGVATAEAFGSPTLTTGAVTVSPTGIASAEALGSPTLTSLYTVSPDAIGSGEAFGSPTLTPGSVTVSPTGVTSAEAFGSPTVSVEDAVVITPTGISSAEAFGAPQLNLTVSPQGIGSAEAFGEPALHLVVLVSGIVSAEAFGTLTLAPGTVTVTPIGVASAQAFGSPVVLGGEQPEVGRRITVVVGLPYGGFHGSRGPTLG